MGQVQAASSRAGTEWKLQITHCLGLRAPRCETHALATRRSRLAAKRSRRRCACTRMQAQSGCYREAFSGLARMDPSSDSFRWRRQSSRRPRPSVAQRFVSHAVCLPTCPAASAGHVDRSVSALQPVGHFASKPVCRRDNCHEI